MAAIWTRRKQNKLQVMKRMGDSLEFYTEISWHSKERLKNTFSDFAVRTQGCCSGKKAVESRMEAVDCKKHGEQGNMLNRKHGKQTDITLM